MLLGNDLWSLKTASMADLALLIFHFRECSYSYLSLYPITVFNLNFSLPRTFLLTLHAFFPPLILMPLLVACSSFLLPLNFASSPFPSQPSLPPLPTSLHLTYFTVYSSFQPISALSDCMHLRVTEGGWPRRFGFGLNPPWCRTRQHNRALVTDKLCMTGIVTHSIPFFSPFFCHLCS